MTHVLPAHSESLKRLLGKLSIVLLTLLVLTTSTNTQASPGESQHSDIILPENGLVLTLPDDFHELGERGQDGFLLSAMSGKGFVFRVSLPDHPQTEAQELDTIQSNSSGFVWQDDFKLGSNFFFVFHKPHARSWHFWLRDASQSVAYLH